MVTVLVYHAGDSGSIPCWRNILLVSFLFFHFVTLQESIAFHLKFYYCYTVFIKQGRIQKFWTGVHNIIGPRRGGSRNFERGVHNIIGPRITVNRLWLLFESLVVASLWKFVFHSGVQPCIRLYGDTHRRKQYLSFWLKSATQCIIPY